MPIFEYKCPDCGNEFEELVFGSKVPACPECGAGNSEKLMSCACVRASDGEGGYTSTGGGCCGCSGGSCASCH